MKTQPKISRMCFSTLTYTSALIQIQKAIVGGTVAKGWVPGDSGVVVRDSGALVGTNNWSTDVLEVYKLDIKPQGELSDRARQPESFEDWDGG